MSGWSRDEYLDMCRRTGRTPDPSIVPPAPERHLPAPERGTSSAPSERTVKRVTSGRCKRLIVRRPELGNRAMTGTEEAWWLAHREQFAHIDLHPTLTLAGGIRYTADFCGWEQEMNVGWLPHLYEIKASEKHARATDIQRIAALCREHPLGPLHVVWTEDGGHTWQELAPLAAEEG